MTEVQQHVMSVSEAEKLTERIRYMAMSVRDGVEKLQQLVSQAQDGQAHLALGYKSWTAYIADVMGEEPLQLRSREERREVVSWLAGQGMSTRAIAPVVGADHVTVSRDLRAGVADETPASPESPVEPTFDPTPSWDVVNTDTGEVTEPAPQPRSITGMDGRTYTRPEKKESPELTKPRRRPIGDAARDAGWEIRKATERIEKLLADDRYPQNREQVTTHLRGHLLYVVESCQGLLDQLD